MWLFLVLLLIPLAIIYYQRRQKKYEEYWKHIMAIPGPEGWPIVGNLLQLGTPESRFLDDRERANKYFPIYKIWNFAAAYVLLMKPEDIEIVINSSKNNTKGFVYKFLEGWLGNGLVLTKGPNWHKRRKILTPAFHFSILQEFTGMLNKETDLLVQHLKGKCHQPYVEIIKPVTEFTLYAIGETSLGISLREDPNCKEYKEAVHEFGKQFAYRANSPWLFFDPIYKLSSAYLKNTQILKILHNFSKNVISEKLKIFDNPSERKKLALLDLLLKSKQDGADIDDEMIREEVDSFIFAEEVYQEIMSVIGPTNAPTYADLGELKYMERCIKESLRLFPSIPSIIREAGEDIKLTSGYTIPKGCDVAILIIDMHRNPTIWKDPDTFDPDRFLPENISKRHPFSYLPFSAGSRNCIGQKYARLELKTALVGLLRAFKFEPYDRLEHLVYKVDIVLRSSGEVRVKLVPRK